MFITWNQQIRTLCIIVTSFCLSSWIVINHQQPSGKQIWQLPPKFTIVKGKDHQFENQGRYNSTYLLLNTDSTFTYYSVFEAGYFLTMGKYFCKGNTYQLDWDSVKTLKAVNNQRIYKKFFKYESPVYFKIVNVQYQRNADSLNRVNQYH